MRKAISAAGALALLFLGTAGYARDSVDGENVVVRPYKNGTFETGEYRFGKAELFGYIGDLKDRHRVTAILLRDGDKASAEQKHVISEIAQAQQLSAVIELGGKRQPLIDPVAPAAVSESAAASAAE